MIECSWKDKWVGEEMPVTWFHAFFWAAQSPEAREVNFREGYGFDMIWNSRFRTNLMDEETDQFIQP